MKKLGHAIELLSYISGYFSGLVLLGIMGLTMAEVVTRYVLHQPLILCDEFGGYSLLAIAFLGMAYCWKERGHIRITFVVTRISGKVSSWLRVATLTIALVYVGLATKVSYDFIVDTFHRNFKSNSWLMTPLSWPGMVIPIGFTLLALILIVELAKAIRNIRSGFTIEAISKEKAEEDTV